LSVDLPDGRNPRPSLESLRALDGLNFCLAALLMGFGPYVAGYLAERGWAPARIGLVLTTSGLIGLAAQVPGGELVDMARSKRALVGTAVIAIAAGLLFLALGRGSASVFTAAALQGMAGSVIGPGVAAISLGLVGHAALGERLGRNQRFASIGSLTAAGAMGLVGYLLSIRDSFLVTIALGLPVLLMLLRMRAADIHFGRCCASADDDPVQPARVSRVVLFKDRGLLTFAACLFLFQIANASVLPLIGEALVQSAGRYSSPVLSASIVLPQIIVALLAPWAGRTAGSWGRRPLLLMGLAVVPIRAGLFALTADPALLIVIQALDGVSGATLGVLTTLVIADLAKGTGRFNLAQGVVGAISGVGASLSTSISGLVVERYGHQAGFLAVTMAGVLAVTILWLFMPETKPSEMDGR
jgi:MFS family permease